MHIYMKTECLQRNWDSEFLGGKWTGRVILIKSSINARVEKALDGCTIKDIKRIGLNDRKSVSWYVWLWVCDRERISEESSNDQHFRLSQIIQRQQRHIRGPRLQQRQHQQQQQQQQWRQSKINSLKIFFFQFSSFSYTVNPDHQLTVTTILESHFQFS